MRTTCICDGALVLFHCLINVVLQTGRSTLAVAGVFGAGKTRSLTFPLAWIAITTNLKIGMVHKENPTGRAITKLLISLDLES